MELAFLSPSPMEMGVIAVIALIVLGPQRLPEVARSLGKGMREMRESFADATGGGDEGVSRRVERFGEDDEDSDEFDPEEGDVDIDVGDDLDEDEDDDDDDLDQDGDDDEPVTASTDGADQDGSDAERAPSPG